MLHGQAIATAEAELSPLLLILSLGYVNLYYYSLLYEPIEPIYNRKKENI